MRRISFIITILGIFTLLIILTNLKPIPLSSSEDLSQYQPNQKFNVKGMVIKESQSEKYKTLYLDNNLKLSCPLPCPSFLNKNITAIAILERYNNNNYLNILKITFS